MDGKHIPRAAFVMRSTGVAPYGVRDWKGERFLEFFQIEPAIGRVTELWLSHYDADGSKYVSVGTFTAGVGNDDRASAHIALDIAIKVINVAMPAPEVPRPEGLNARLMDHARSQAQRWKEWDTDSVQVGDAHLECRYWRFADSIAAFVPAARLWPPMVVLLRGIELRELAFEPKSDTAPYGFDTSGFTHQDMHGISGERPRSYHPDFEVPS